MKAWMLARCYDDIVRDVSTRWVVLTEDWKVYEFSFDEIALLSHFMSLIGYSKDKIMPSVFLGNASFSSVVTFPDRLIVIGADSVIDTWKRDGFLFLGYDMCPYDADLAMRYGIKALVTDRGRLIYLDTRKRSSLVVGEFCNAINKGAIQGGAESTIYLDDRISYIELNFYIKLGGSIDISKLHNVALRGLVLRDSAGHKYKLVGE